MTFLRFICFIGLAIACCSAIHVSVRNGEKLPYCIILDANITGTVHYKNSENVDVPYDFVVNGTSVSGNGKCHQVSRNDSIEYVDISFYPNDITPPTPQPNRWIIKLIFKSPSSVSPPTKSFEIDDYKLTAYFYSDVFNTTTPSYVYEKDGDANLDWSASEKHAFQCTNSPLALTNSSKIDFSNLKVVAFAMLLNGTFPAAQEFESCQLDMRTSDLVPIIVGACLAGLVIVVLIAYIIGRARAKRQGYASV